ncbi:MAG: DUF4091 domain-containing protein [Bacteroidales bacterium]|nr:DUF4091 domain-containing protein [Bacteroidales bacterium]
MKTSVYLLVIAIFMAMAGCQEAGPGERSLSEPVDPGGIQSASWSGVSKGLKAGFGSADTRYPRSKPPQGEISEKISLTGWRGEKIHCQMLFWSSTNEGTVELKMVDNENNSPFSENGIIISAVRYVLADEFLKGCGYRDKDTISAHLMPDMLDTTNIFKLPGMHTRPVWISIKIPVEAQAGTYELRLEACAGHDTLKNTISLEVQDKILPPPNNWSFHLDLWQNPFAVARYHNVQLWSREHTDLLKDLLQMLASAGQKCITATITPEPWGGQTYDPFESMITWLKNSDGFWEYDYSVFDQYVQLAMDCGIDEQINCYSMVPWANKYSWFDQDSGRYITREILPGSEEYKNTWRSFLNDFRAHLMEMGWFDKVTIALDERGVQEMKDMFAFLEESAPDFKVSMAGHYFSDINKKIYDFSYNWRHIQDGTGDVIARRKEEGKKTSYYVACGIEKPNSFTFSPPAESSYFGWFAAAMGFDGFLRWAYNSWPENPVQDSRFISWPSGDTYLVYPGARSSIRFERLIEGIQDYEKIRILREDLALNPSMEAAEAEAMISEFLSLINTASLDSLPAHEIINKGRQMINVISRIR